MNTPYKFLSAKILLSCFCLTAIAMIASCKKDSDDSAVIPPDSNYGQPGNGGYDQQGNPFTSVIIGSQEWMSKNLSVVIYTDGTPIPKVTDQNVWASLTTGAWCWFLNDSANYAAIYGRLYNWYAVAGIHNAASESNASLRKKLAPSGWHVATDAEWTVLSNQLGGEDLAGGKMKTTGNIEASTGLWLSPNTGATNISSFSAVPGGYRNQWFFEFNKYEGVWWSSSEVDAGRAWTRSLNYDSDDLVRGIGNAGYGYSVRCLRN
jgi:uncharacterized protein (TIGR02145 family)